LKASVIVMSGCSAFSFSSALRTTFRHLDLAGTAAARDLEADHRPTVEQRRRARFADRVDTVATWSRRTRRPSESTMSIAASSSADCTVAMVRTDCSMPPTSARPPEASCWMRRNWREMSAAVALSASRRAGSSSTRISRVTPPTRATAPTPRTASMALVTVLSTNQESASSSIRCEATV
jgi:hypothetical protein